MLCQRGGHKNTLSNDTYSELLNKIFCRFERSRAAGTARSRRSLCRWEIGRLIDDFDQGGRERAVRGNLLMRRLAAGLTRRCGRKISSGDLRLMRAFYLTWPIEGIPESGIQRTPPQRGGQRPESEFSRASFADRSSSFPLSWTHYVYLLNIENPYSRHFYEEEALRRGWSARHLRRRIGPPRRMDS